ncbi:DNA/RNA non-specific endonuclease [Dongshaea marina]|uniref:DNA/RNA non-specific endonuclease n=1 Tax=Dongshaea marina TaxID=2047966 RepID=UPI000D3EAFDA|nr:DNA/RNA non-specific endonuclease [Dongshaea marina]
MKKQYLLLSSALLLTTSAFAQSISAPVCYQHSCPVGAPSGDHLIVRDLYALDNNGSTKFADWVAYRVSSVTIHPSDGHKCSRVWKADPDLDPTHTLQPSDYSGAHAQLATDRGHQAPLGSLCGFSDWKATDYLSNITPQKSDLNQGPWEKLEQAVRDKADIPNGEVYVVTGPYYDPSQPMPTLPANSQVMIPNGYWKVVAAKVDGQLQTAAFIMSQDAGRKDDFCDYRTTVKAVDLKAGFSVMPALTSDEESSPHNWLCS